MSRESKTVLRYGRGQTLLGEAVVLVTDKGVRELRLLGDESLTKVLSEMRSRHPEAELREDAAVARRAFAQVHDWLDGKIPARELALDLAGTPFQMRVWREMLRIPHGTTCTYTDLARRAGKPLAVRAAASACARNPVGLLVPCHRVVRQDGSLGGYYWGLDRKKWLLDYECSHKSRVVK